MKSLIDITDRIVEAEVGGVKYKFLLSTWAASEISKKYGGFDKVESALDENSPDILENIFFILSLLANAAILYLNTRMNSIEKKRETLPNDYFLVRTTPIELTGLKDVIFDCINKGMERNIESDDSDEEEKNVETA